MAAVMILNPRLAEQYLAGREALPEDRRREEVWDGVTYIMPDPNPEHAELMILFGWAFRSVFFPDAGARVFGPTNVSDREVDWTQNYRCPDLCVFLAGNPAVQHAAHWQGGPDLALEIVSVGDRSRDKLDFYAGVGTREVLILDRNPWQIELYQLSRGKMRLRGTVPPGKRVVTSAVAPLSFQLVRSEARPNVKIVHTETGQEWVG